MPPRYLDLECTGCGTTVDDLFVMSRPARIIHFECGAPMEEVLRSRTHATTQWSERDSIVVFKGADGKIRYPGRNDAPTPRGCERVSIRSLPELRAFERQHGVVSHIANYDRGSGRAIDDSLPEPRIPSERERWERFRERTRGIF